MHATIDLQTGKASIGNDWVELEMEFEQTLRLIHFRNQKTITDWISCPSEGDWGTDDHDEALICGWEGLWPDLAPPSSEFLLRYSKSDSAVSLDPTEYKDGNEKNRSITLTGASACTIVPEKSRAWMENDAARLDLTVALADHHLEVAVHTEIRDNTDMVRRWTTIHNTGEKPILLHQLLSLMVSVRPGYSDLDLYWVEVFHHDQRLWRQATVHQERITATVRRKLLYGPYSRLHDGSHGCMGWLALRDPVLDEGIFAGWEWSGLFDAEVGDFREGAGTFGLRAGFSDEGNYARKIGAGESFTTPRGFLGFFQGDVAAAARATQALAEKVFTLPWPQKKAPMFVGYDTWNNWQEWQGRMDRHLNPDRLDREIEITAGLGVELYILDYDWFPRLGDYVSDPQRLPDGVEAVSAKVKAAGMKFGLWMGFGQAHQDSQVVRDHPEWLVTKNGKAVTGGWGLRSLCLGYPPCRDWVLEQVSRVVKTFGVEWLKHDFDLIPISDAHHHCPAATDSRIETVLGYYYIMEKLHERFPHLYLDNWTPATGGADFGNFQRHHSTLMADWYSAVTVRSALNGISHLISPTRTHGYLRMFSKADEKNPYYYRSGFFGNGLYFLNDILQWDEETIRVTRREIVLLKEDRELFHTGEIYTLIAKQPDHFGWEARFVYSSEAGRGMAQVFRNHNPADQWPVIFQGLQNTAAYLVSLVDAERTQRISGEELMTRGITVHLEKPFTCEIIRVEKVV